jgi:hypothetical protein
MFTIRSVARSVLRLGMAVLLLGAVVPARVAAQDTASTRNLRPTPDSQLVKLTLRDGSTLVGRVVEVTPTSVLFSSAIGRTAIPRSAIRRVDAVPAASLHDGEYWPEDPSRTRLFFAPTGRMLRQGEGYFSDAYIFFPSFQGGLTDRVTLGGGASLIPGLGLGEQIFYVTPKIGIVAGRKLNVAVGALVAGAGEFFDEGPFGIGYGVATYGGEDGSVTTGAGFAFDRTSTSRAILMLGGSRRVSRNLALVSENYFVTEEHTSALISGGIRFMSERIAVDLAGFTASDTDVPIIPYVAFIYKF